MEDRISIGVVHDVERDIINYNISSYRELIQFYNNKHKDLRHDVAI